MSGAAKILPVVFLVSCTIGCSAQSPYEAVAVNTDGSTIFLDKDSFQRITPFAGPEIRATILVRHPDGRAEVAYVAFRCGERQWHRAPVLGTHDDPVVIEPNVGDTVTESDHPMYEVLDRVCKDQ